MVDALVRGEQFPYLLMPPMPQPAHRHSPVGAGDPPRFRPFPYVGVRGEGPMRRQDLLRLDGLGGRFWGRLVHGCLPDLAR